MKTGAPRNPGDPDRRTLVERVIRVDQAGEFGAVRIYEGQLAVRLLCRKMSADESAQSCRVNEWNLTEIHDQNR